VVSESGIKNRGDIEKMKDWGVNAVLVGEALVTADDIPTKMRELGNMTFIKICGLKEEAHALAAAEAGADFIGLVFAPSPRQVTPGRAEKIVAALKQGGFVTEVVGVFVNRPAAEVNHLADACHLDWVQLSGDETWQYCLDIKKPIIKAFRVSRYQHPDTICASLAIGERVLSPKKHMHLLDSRVKGKYGGSGMAFDWNRAKPATERFTVIVAGGITPDNVAQAVKIAVPHGVDASSGVETGGAKDMAKIKALIEAVRKEDGK
jgi:phosphoribosylanthranilate isomerase